MKLLTARFKNAAAGLLVLAGAMQFAPAKADPVAAGSFDGMTASEITNSPTMQKMRAHLNKPPIERNQDELVGASTQLNAYIAAQTYYLDPSRENLNLAQKAVENIQGYTTEANPDLSPLSGQNAQVRIARTAATINRLTENSEAIQANLRSVGIEALKKKSKREAAPLPQRDPRKPEHNTQSAPAPVKTLQHVKPATHQNSGAPLRITPPRP